jgi:hypothetical protein
MGDRPDFPTMAEVENADVSTAVSRSRSNSRGISTVQL